MFLDQSDREFLLREDRCGLQRVHRHDRGTAGIRTASPTVECHVRQSTCSSASRKVYDCRLADDLVVVVTAKLPEDSVTIGGLHKQCVISRV